MQIVLLVIVIMLERNSQKDLYTNIGHMSKPNLATTHSFLFGSILLNGQIILSLIVKFVENK